MKAVKNIKTAHTRLTSQFNIHMFTSVSWVVTCLLDYAGWVSWCYGHQDLGCWLDTFIWNDFSFSWRTVCGIYNKIALEPTTNSSPHQTALLIMLLLCSNLWNLWYDIESDISCRILLRLSVFSAVEKSDKPTANGFNPPGSDPRSLKCSPKPQGTFIGRRES